VENLRLLDSVWSKGGQSLEVVPKKRNPERADDILLPEISLASPEFQSLTLHVQEKPSPSIERGHEDDEEPEKEKTPPPKNFSEWLSFIAKRGREEFEDFCFVVVEALSHATISQKVAIVGSFILFGVTVIPGGQVAVMLFLSQFSPYLGALYAFGGEWTLRIIAGVLALFGTGCFKKYVWKKVFDGLKSVVEFVTQPFRKKTQAND
jgi:hypothetical protein